MIRHYLIFILTLFLLHSPSLHASEAVIIALDRAWHPLSYLDENNQPQGVLIDYWRLAGKKLGRPVEFRLVDWQQSLDLVRDGKADIHGGLFQSPQRDAYLDFSDNVLPLSTRLFVSSKLNARSFSDLENVQVGITKGGYESEFVDKHFPSIRLKHYSNNELLVRSSLKGEVLAFVADYPVGMYYLHKYGTPEQYQVVYKLYNNQLKSAVAKGHGPLLQNINAALNSISNEEKNNITQKWIRTETITPAWLMSTLIIVVTGLLIIGGFTYTILLKTQVRHKTRELRREVEESLKLRTENIELVKELRKQKEEAEQANIAKSKFLAAASHDLRQPLHALILFTSVLDDSIQDPKVRRVVDQIKASVYALQTLFNALLDISRLEAGVMKVEKANFNLQPMFKKLANDFNPQANEKNLIINWPDCSFSVHSDQTLLEQILLNYLSNAIRYTEKGEINVTCESDGDLLTINVTDTGVGIPEEEQQEIFKEFHQLSNPERDRNNGLGLGLAIVQRTAKLLRHSIHVDSQPGKGSNFSITLEQVDITEAPAGATAHADDTPFPVDTVLVAVIDDEISVREGTQALLETWDFDVITAADKHDVLLQLRNIKREPDCIIADYRLRENQSGIEVIHAIHAKYDTDIPALIVTGEIAAERLREVNNSGFQVLHKPVAPIRLRTFLRNIQLRKKKYKS